MIKSNPRQEFLMNQKIWFEPNKRTDEGQYFTIVEVNQSLHAANEENRRLKKQLKLAIKRLEYLKKWTDEPYYIKAFKPINEMCQKTLKEIEELNK